LKKFGNFQPTNKQLLIDFEKAINKNVNIYAFGEGLPLDDNWVDFTIKHLDCSIYWIINLNYTLNNTIFFWML
jgi:hypothetical protein